jgi:hypothetical protein
MFTGSVMQHRASEFFKIMHTFSWVVIVILFSVLCTLADTLVPLHTSPYNTWPGRVALSYDYRVTQTISVDTACLRRMLDSCVTSLTNAKTAGSGWKSLFPSPIQKSSIIAIKTNLINPGNNTPHYYLILSIVKSLLSIRIDNKCTLPPENIIVYDASNRHSFTEANYIKSQFPPIRFVKDTLKNYGDGADDYAYASSLNKCAYLINVFSLSGHNQNYGGFFLGFKNHYGSYDPALAAKKQEGLVAMNCTGPVYNKTILSICCGLYGIDEGKGPFGGVSDFSTYIKSIDPNSKGKNPNTLIMSTDPVSCEALAIKILRINKNRSFATDSLPDYLKASAGIRRPNLPVYNIGIIDEKLMDIRKVIATSFQ